MICQKNFTQVNQGREVQSIKAISTVLEPNPNLFLQIGLNCLKAVEPLRGDSVLLTTKSLGVLERIKG